MTDNRRTVKLIGWTAYLTSLWIFSCSCEPARAQVVYGDCGECDGHVSNFSVNFEPNVDLSAWKASLSGVNADIWSFYSLKAYPGIYKNAQECQAMTREMILKDVTSPEEEKKNRILTHEVVYDPSDSPVTYEFLFTGCYFFVFVPKREHNCRECYTSATFLKGSFDYVDLNVSQQSYDTMLEGSTKMTVPLKDLSLTVSLYDNLGNRTRSFDSIPKKGQYVAESPHQCHVEYNHINCTNGSHHIQQYHPNDQPNGEWSFQLSWKYEPGEENRFWVVMYEWNGSHPIVQRLWRSWGINVQYYYLLQKPSLAQELFWMQRKLDTILSILRNSFRDTEIAETGNKLPRFPLDSNEKFSKFNDELKTDEILREQFQNLIRRIDGTSTAAHVTNTLVATLTDRFAQKLTWEGRRATNGIKNTPFASIITGPSEYRTPADIESTQHPSIGTSWETIVTRVSIASVVLFVLVVVAYVVVIKYCRKKKKLDHESGLEDRIFNPEETRDILFLYARDDTPFTKRMEALRDELQKRGRCEVYDYRNGSDIDHLWSVSQSQVVQKWIGSSARFVWFDTPKLRGQLRHERPRSPDYDFRDRFVEEVLEVSRRYDADPKTKYNRHYVVRIDDDPAYRVHHEPESIDPLSMIAQRTYYYLPGHLDLLCKILTGNTYSEAVDESNKEMERRRNEINDANMNYSNPRYGLDAIHSAIPGKDPSRKC